MRQFIIGIALSIAVSACGSFDPEDGLAIEPDASTYRAGDAFRVDVRNTVRAAVYLGVCPTLYRQLETGEEQVANSVPCPAVLHTLAPGESLAMSGVIPPSAEGEYRVGVQFWRDPARWDETRADARSRIIRVE